MIVAKFQELNFLIPVASVPTGDMEVTIVPTKVVGTIIFSPIVITYHNNYHGIITANPVL